MAYQLIGADPETGELPPVVEERIEAKYTPRGDLFTGLAATLKQGYQSTGILVTGDSTSTPDTAWFRLLADHITAQFPTFNSRYWKWNSATESFSRPVTLRDTGNKRRMTMVSGGSRTGRFAAGANITGPVEIIVHMKSPTYNTGTTQVIASKYPADGQASWQFALGGDGLIRFQYSTDGSATLTAMTSTTGHALVDGTAYFLRCQFTPNDGAGNRVARFDKSTDGVTWTQIGTTVTTAGVATIFASTGPYSVGARGSSANPCVAGTEFYELWIKDGINGGPVVPVLPHTWTNTIGANASLTEGDPELNFILAAEPGAGIGYEADGNPVNTTGYLTDPVRLRRLTPDMMQQVAFFNSSHNDYNLRGRDFRNRYMGWIESVTARMPLVERIGLTQNPRTGAHGGASANNIGHTTRRGQMLSMSQTERLKVIDTFQAFLDDGRPMTDLIGDGLHPSAAGYQVWFERLKVELDAALARIGAY